MPFISLIMLHMDLRTYIARLFLMSLEIVIEITYKSILILKNYSRNNDRYNHFHLGEKIFECLNVATFWFCNWLRM